MLSAAAAQAGPRFTSAASAGTGCAAVSQTPLEAHPGPGEVPGPSPPDDQAEARTCQVRP